MARPLALAACAALLATLVFATQAISETPAECKGGTHKEIEVGIVKAVGCFTEATQGNATVYTGKWVDQPDGHGIDLNGFVLTGPKGGALQINAGNREVKSVAIGQGNGDDQVQLNSMNWPVAGELKALGSPINLGFVAPEKGSVTLTQLTFGSNFVGGALAGLSPFGAIETPVKLEDDGKGSMDLSIMLAGYFTLKGHPQSVTIALPTESEKGTKVDGFEISLEEIDTFKVVKINEFEAKYSAAEKLVKGSANLTFPFSAGGTKENPNEKGFGGGFALENGALTEIKASASGLKIPVGAPPGGFITGIGGGFHLKNGQGNNFDLSLNAKMDAQFGPEIPTPWGKAAPIEVSAALGAGHKGEEWFFEIRGGVKVFRLAVGDVYLGLHSNAGVEFGVGLGIGFPSYRNNESDPFYIGARVDGWVSKGHFQFEGKGKVALISLKLFEGRVMVNDRAAGACWVVFGFPGGAVYPYGGQVKDFGIGCGLDYYKEQFPQGARISALGSRTIQLEPAEKIIAVKGAGKAPRFTLRSGDRVLRTPTDRDAVIQRQGFRHAFFVNEETDTTHVIIPRSAGNWTITPYAGSATITSVRAGREAPKEKVTAEVTGSGPVRTLHWDSLDRPHTRLLFLERLPSGREVPILQTDEESGARKFGVVTGANYGKRNIRVVVIHGYASRQSGIVDDYRVAKPRQLAGPKRVSAWRDGHRAHVTWSGVKAARGYLVEVTMPGKGGQRASNYVRRAGAKQRSLVIPEHPGGGVAIAKVYALNRDDRQGVPGRASFRTDPPPLSLKAATKRSVDSLRFRRNAVTMRMSCPSGPHCRVVAELRVGKRVIASERFQQTPDSFHMVRLVPRSASARQALRAGEARLLVRARRTDDARAAGLTVVEP
jgi:hypothetical protein